MLLIDKFSQEFSLLSDIKEHCQTYQQVEEESKRMLVWCVSLMAVFGWLADKTTGQENSEQMLENAAGALKKVRNLIIKRTQTSKGLLGKAAAFWTSAEFRNQIQIASDWLEKAIQALALSVSVQIKADMSQVLSQVDILPRINERITVIEDKIDRMGGMMNVSVKKSSKEQILSARRFPSTNVRSQPLSSRRAFLSAKVGRLKCMQPPMPATPLPSKKSQSKVR